jgi:hypothetical protein
MVSIGGVYTVTVTNVNGCKGVAEKTLSVILLPNAGLDASVNCYLTGSATMSANGVGEWKLGLSSVGNATIDSTTNPNTTVNGFSEAGTYIMIWSNGICQDSISIFVDDICDCPIENNFISSQMSDRTNKKTTPTKIYQYDDWTCLMCQNLNYSFRKTCTYSPDSGNRCRVQTKENNDYLIEVYHASVYLAMA